MPVDRQRRLGRPHEDRATETIERLRAGRYGENIKAETDQVVFGRRLSLEADDGVLVSLIWGRPRDIVLRAIGTAWPLESYDLYLKARATLTRLPYFQLVFRTSLM